MGIASFLIYRLIKGKGLMLEMMESMPNRAPVPDFLINLMEKHVAVLFLLYGIFMIGVALWLSTDLWLFFKTAGFYIAFGVFMLFEVIYMRIQMKKLIENAKKAELLNQMRP